MDIFRISDELKISIEKIDSKKEANFAKTNNKNRKSESGFCIRCKEQVKLDPMHPYCKKCYTSWNRYKNEEYKEKYCHMCGNSTTSSKIKPICYKCYKKHKNDYNLPS